MESNLDVGEQYTHVVIEEMSAGGWWPKAGDHVQCDGRLYRIVSVTGTVLTGVRKGAPNHMFGVAEEAEWEDIDENENPFPVRRMLSSEASEAGGEP